MIPIRGPLTISGSSSRSQELEGRAVEREAVLLAGHPERLAEAAGAGTEAAKVVEAAAGAHLVETVPRLDSAEEDGGRSALLLADKIQAPMHAVGAVDVRVPGRAEHRAVAGRLPSEAVARRILLVVGLDLDDRPADAVDEERAADEIRRDVVHAARKKLPS